MPPPVLRTHTPGDAPRTPASGPRSVFRLFRGCKSGVPLIRTFKIQRYDDRKVINIKEKAKNRLFGRVLKSPELTPEAFFMHQTMTKIIFLELD